MPISRAKIAIGVPVGLAVSEITSFWLRRAHPRPVGLTVESAMPRMLGSHGWGPGLTYISLVYGYANPRDTARPKIEVMTCFSPPHCYLPSLEQVLARAAHADEADARDDWEDSTSPFGDPAFEVAVPAGGFSSQDRTVVLEGQHEVVSVVCFRHYEALRFRQDKKVVMAVARFGFPGTPSFHTVDDLRPYVAGRRRFTLSLLRLLDA